MRLSVDFQRHSLQKAGLHDCIEKSFFIRTICRNTNPAPGPCFAEDAMELVFGQSKKKAADKDTVVESTIEQRSHVVYVVSISDWERGQTFNNAARSIVFPLYA